MRELVTRDVFIELGGQDDNLGDSVLRAAYLRAARGQGHRIHLFLGPATTDYVSGLQVLPSDLIHPTRTAWAAASEVADRPVHLLNAGEINPAPGLHPAPSQIGVVERAVRSGGAVIAAGVGIRHPENPIDFHPVVREAALIAWRDAVSAQAAGFGEVAPDWAFALGTPSGAWAPAAERDVIALTLRFDRPWPGEEWLGAVRDLARATGRRIVTLAQVARDAPRAVRLAAAVGGDYLVAPSTRHDDLDAHARAIYARSLAVVSDRAHGLIIAATEGALPIGSAADPQKLSRMLAVVGLDATVGTYAQVADIGAGLGGGEEAVESTRRHLAHAIDTARTRISDLEGRIQAVMTQDR